MNPLPPYIIERQKAWKAEVISLSVAATLLNEQVSDTGTKTINYPVFEKNFVETVDRAALFLLESLALQLETLAGEAEGKITVVMNDFDAGEVFALQNLASSYREQAKIIRNEQ